MPTSRATQRTSNPCRLHPIRSGVHETPATGPMRPLDRLTCHHDSPRLLAFAWLVHEAAGADDLHTSMQPCNNPRANASNLALFPCGLLLYVSFFSLESAIALLAPTERRKQENAGRQGARIEVDNSERFNCPSPYNQCRSSAGPARPVSSRTTPPRTN